MADPLGTGAGGRAAPEARAALRAAALERDGWRCRNPLCRAATGLQVDHAVPRAHGGPDTLENLVTLCARCHALKHQGILLVLPDGSGGVRVWDTRRVLTCEVCQRRIARGELVAVPTPGGGLRWIVAP